MEDLWSFNSEIVVRAIAESVIPVISGVGHEIDVTLADLAADVRALTPSEAAERLVPNLTEVTHWIDSNRLRMNQSLVNRIRNAYDQLDALATRPVITQPLERIRQAAMEVDFLEGQMNRAAARKIQSFEQQLKEIAFSMESLNPVSVLARGYSLTTKPDGALIDDCNSIKPGDKIKTRVTNGNIESVVEKIETTESR